MSKMIRLSDRVIEEAKQFLIMKGMGSQGMSNAEVIRRCISLALYGTPHFPDGRELTEMMLDNRGGMIKAHVSKWAQTADWDGERAAPSLPKEYLEALRETQETLSSPISVEGPLVKAGAGADAEEGRKRRKVMSSQPPWEYLPKSRYEDILRLYRTHPALKWAGDDPLRRRVIMCAFAAAPRTIVKTERFMDIVRDLYQNFQDWEEWASKRQSEEEKESA